MQIIEFFGLPYSGKSYYTDLCKNIFKQKKIYSVKSIFYYYLLKEKKINHYLFFVILIKLFFLKNKKKLLKNNTINIRNKDHFKILKKKIFFKSFFLINKERYKLFFRSRKKYKIFYTICKNIINNEGSLTRKKELHRWLVDELNAFYLARENKLSGILIISEGFIQRIHSYFINKKKLDADTVKRYLNHMPISDYIFYIKCDIELIKSRLEQKLEFKKEKFYYENITTLNNKMTEIYEIVQNIGKIYLVNDTSSLKKIISSEIFEK